MLLSAIFPSIWYLGNIGCYATNDTMYNMSGNLLLFQVNALNAPLTKAHFQNYWWSYIWQGPYNKNMVVAIFILMYMTSILLPFAVPIQEFYTFLLRKRDMTSRGPFSFHDAKKISYALFCDNCTALNIGMSLYAHLSLCSFNQFICFLNIMRVRITDNRYTPPVQLVLYTSHV